MVDIEKSLKLSIFKFNYNNIKNTKQKKNSNNNNK